MAELETASKPTRIQSVSRAASVLRLLAAQRDPLSARAVADELGVTSATAHHILNTLSDEGLIYKAHRGGYELGPGIGVLGHAYQQRQTPPPALIEGLRRLGEETGESVYLVGWRHRDIAILDIVEGSHAVRVGELTLGVSLHPHARASGKSLLAFASDEQRDAFVAKHPLVPVTPHTITDRTAFEAALATIRELGYSTEQEEFKQGVGCVAAPIRTDGVVLHSYAASAPLDRFLGTREQLVEVTVRIAGSVST